MAQIFLVRLQIMPWPKQARHPRSGRPRMSQDGPITAGGAEFQRDLRVGAIVRVPEMRSPPNPRTIDLSTP
jgi:hypothetical protein